MADFHNFTKSEFFMKLLAEISEAANNLWNKGWAERNAGNFSINITQHFDNIKPINEINHALPVECSHLAGMVFIVSATGSRMRHISLNPADFITIVAINRDASAYSSYSLNGDTTIIPTSELPVHLAIHNLLAGKGKTSKVALHAHVTELIALTHIPEINNEALLNRILLSMHPECSMFVPDGCGYVPFCEPGTAEIASATVAALENHDIAIWDRHGAFAVATDIQEAFDMLDIFAKSADIYLRCRSAGFIPKGMQSTILQPLVNQQQLENFHFCCR
jgi:rhamnulose-1-phosphate aldolase